MSTWPEPLPVAVKEKIFPIEVSEEEKNAGFRHLVICIPHSQTDICGGRLETIVVAKKVKIGALLVKMNDPASGDNVYGLYIYGRDPEMLDRDFVEPEWSQSWEGLPNSVDLALARLKKKNLGIDTPIHRDPPPPERTPTNEELNSADVAAGGAPACED